MSDDKKVGASRALELIQGGGAAAIGQQAVNEAVQTRLTPEEANWMAQYQELTTTLLKGLSKAKYGVEDVERGAPLLEEAVGKITDAVRKECGFEVSLPQYIVFFAVMLGSQVGMSRVNGYDVPDAFIQEAGHVFSSGAKVIAASTEIAYAGQKQ